MVAVGIGAPIFLLLQTVVAAFVYREATGYDRRSPLILALSVFVVAVGTVVVVGRVLIVLGIQALGIAVYLLGTAGRRPAAE